MVKVMQVILVILPVFVSFISGEETVSFGAGRNVDVYFPDRGDYSESSDGLVYSDRPLFPQESQTKPNGPVRRAEEPRHGYKTDAHHGEVRYPDFHHNTNRYPDRPQNHKSGLLKSVTTGLLLAIPIILLLGGLSIFLPMFLNPLNGVRFNGGPATVTGRKKRSLVNDYDSVQQWSKLLTDAVSR